MDSMGMGALVRVYVAACAKAARELRYLGKKVRELLIKTNLLPAFTIAGEHSISM